MSKPSNPINPSISPNQLMPSTQMTSTANDTNATILPGQTQAADPLAELRDIQVDTGVSGWPPALGWWVLSILIIFAIAAAVSKLVLRYQHKAYQRAAEQQLHLITESYNQDKDSRKLLDELGTLLRRACLTRFPRREVAALNGEEWLKFLDETGGTSDFSSGCGRALVEQRYMASTQPTDCSELLQVCSRWIKGL